MNKMPDSPKRDQEEKKEPKDAKHARGPKDAAQRAKDAVKDAAKA